MPIPLLVPVLLAGGGVAYVVAKQKPAVPPNALVNGSNQISGGGSAPIPSVVATGGTRPIGRHLPATAGGLMRPVIAGSHNDPDPPMAPSPQADPQKLDMVQAAMSKAYGKINDATKQLAARDLSDQLGIDPPLTGNESWSDLEQITESAIGAGIGGAIGGPIGAKLGALAAAYFGKDINRYLNETLDELQSDLSDAFDSASQYVEDAVSSAASDVGDAVSDAASSAYDDASDYVGSLF